MPQLTWIGKDKIANYAQKAPFHLLEKRYQYGDGSHNKIIHGDNLLALKSLLPQYENKIKCIYIDPPYNTGNENWVYNDNVNSPQIQRWLGQVVGKPAEDFSRHDKWLCMMYPRLQLLRRLLADNGVIFISIDDNEQANLKLICDEIFGELNFVDNMVVYSNRSGRDYGGIAKVHEYVLVYRKSEECEILPIADENKQFPFKDIISGFETRELRNRNIRFNSENRPNLYYPFFVNPNSKDENGFYEISLDEQPDFIPVFPIESQGVKTVWRWGKELANKNLNINIIGYQSSNGWRIMEKYRKNEKMIRSILDDKQVRTEQGTIDLKSIFGYRPFDYPKSTKLIETLIQVGTTSEEECIILDSFAGSGTTAHAVMNLNKADGGNRQFILIETEDYAETITAERVRRVMAGYGEVAGLGGGFGYYELGQALFLENGFLNEAVPTEQIKEYVYHTETKQVYQPHDGEYSMGEYEGRGYYFYYEKDSECRLDMDFVATINYRSQAYTIYADVCGLSEAQLEKYNITYKKIPRDISRL